MKTFVLAVSLLAVVACHNFDVLTPASGPNTPYPCGILGTVCPASMCCPSENVCGGTDPSCPAGQCCFVGDDSDHDHLGASRARRMTPQTPATTSP